MVTNKNKEQFEKWQKDENWFVDADMFGEDYTNLEIFNELPFDLQIGVYLAYYDNIRLSIEVKPIDNWDSWCFVIYGEDCQAPFYQVLNSGLIECKTRNEAYKEAFKKADALINKQLN